MVKLYFQNSSTQILECVQHILRRTISWTWKSSLQCCLHKDCFYKVEQFQLCFWLTACKYVSATDDSNVSFEHCRVVLVVCRFSDHKCRHGNVYMAWCNATRKKTIWVIIISNYVPTGCNKCLVYKWVLLFLCRRAGTWHHNTVRDVTFPSHAWGIRC